MGKIAAGALALGSAVCAGGAAQATIITGTATGEVTQVETILARPGDVFAADTVTVNFSYDTTAATGFNGIFTMPSLSITMTFNTRSGPQVYTQSSGDVVIRNDTFGIFDSFSLFENFNSTITGLDLLDETRHSLTFSGGTTLLTDLNLNDPPFDATQLTDILGFLDSEGQGQPNMFWTISYRLDPASLRITSRPANAVPEPASLAMLSVGLGAIGLAVLRRRQRAGLRSDVAKN